LDKSSTDNEESNSFSRGLMERFLYGLATLLFCTVPFLIPGITTKQGGMVFFGEIIILFLGIIIFSIVVNKKNSRKVQKK
jgi:hypothetical protein